MERTQNDARMILSVTCPLCGKKTLIEVKREDLMKWEHGENVQTTFPYLSPAEREMFITGICDDCWTDMFGKEEEE